MTALQKVVSTFRRWLHLPDLGPLLIYLGSLAANRMQGDPVWLMFVGPPSSGKNEILLSGSAVPGVIQAGALTEAGLLSGSPASERQENATGGLLREIGDQGIVIMKDFNTVLAMHRDARARVIAALREIYDGQWTRHLGTDGGIRLSWSGKVGLIAGCTPHLDRHHAVISAMGERFVFCRMLPADEEKLAEQALAHVSREAEMRRELANVVTEFFEQLMLPSKVQVLTPELRQGVVALATLAARCRSSVERDTYSRQIEQISEPESPGRLARILAQLFAGMLAVGIEPQEAWSLVKRVGMDSMPVNRRGVFEFLLKELTGSHSTKSIAETLRLPTQTTRHTLEDLHVHGILTRSKQGKELHWALSDLAVILFFTAETTFPKSQET